MAAKFDLHALLDSTSLPLQEIESKITAFPVFNLVTVLNHLTPNGHYIGRTAQLTSRCCILYIYSTNIRMNILNILHNLRFFLFKMSFIS